MDAVSIIRAGARWSTHSSAATSSASHRVPAGAHKAMNRSDAPARTLLFSSSRAPSVSVYPNSDTMGVYPASGRNDLVFERSSSVPWAHNEEGWDKAL